MLCFCTWFFYPGANVVVAVDVVTAVVAEANLVFRTVVSNFVVV